MSEIPEYFDEAKPCPKCWWSPVSVHLCDKNGIDFSYPGGSIYHPVRTTHPAMPVEHLHRVCGRCGHDWIELPWDTKPILLEDWREAVKEIEDWIAMVLRTSKEEVARLQERERR